MPSFPTLECVLAPATDARLIVDESGIIRCASVQACQLLKYAPGELDGRSVELLIPERFRFAHIGYRLRFADDRRTRLMGAGRPLFALCKDRSERPVNISLNAIPRGLDTFTVLTIHARGSDSRLIHDGGTVAQC